MIIFSEKSVTIHMSVDQISFGQFKIKFIFQETEDHTQLKLTKLNNLGSKSRRMIVSTFRFKKSLCDAVVCVAPDIEDVKIRVTDSDVEYLAAIKNIKSVELVSMQNCLQCPIKRLKRY